VTTSRHANRRGVVPGATVTAALATAIALWLGLTAPSAPPVPAPPAATQAAADDPGAGVAQPVPPGDGRPRRGGR
jgi:hypothetical protein